MCYAQRDLRHFKTRYHRNGVTGTGIHACSFKIRDGRRFIDMQAIVFPEAGSVAVTSGGIDRRWRGDDFEPALRDAITAWETAQPEFVYGWPT